MNRDVVTLDCPAKLNLCLKIIGRRPDGYHDLDSVMVPLAWGDTLTLKRTTEKSPRTDLTVIDLRAASSDVNSVRAEGNDASSRASSDGDDLAPIPTGPENLVCRAVDELRREAKMPGGIEVTLWKRVPSGAGLGGGSSDAATALRAASRLFGLNLRGKQLSDVASRIGSDVPFFLAEGPARVTGRGEFIDPLDAAATNALIGQTVIVVRPPVSLSTPVVFGQFQAGDVNTNVSVDRWLAEVRDNGLATLERKANSDGITNATRFGLPFNDLEPAARRLTPWIDTILNLFQDCGVPGGMSGSGSACYALAGSAERGTELRTRLRQLLPVSLVLTRIVGLSETSESR